MSVQVITSEGAKWYGSLDQESKYQALIEWARARHAMESLVPRPRNRSHRFSGYIRISDGDDQVIVDPQNPTQRDPPS
jgi:hypothetical protein